MQNHRVFSLNILILRDMKKYRITYKEIGKPKPGSTYYAGNKTEAQVIEFFGLDEPEVEWYKVELIN